MWSRPSISLSFISGSIEQRRKFRGKDSRSRRQKRKADSQDDDSDDVSDEDNASPPPKSNSKKGVVLKLM